MNTNNTSHYTRAGIGRIGSPLAGGIYSGMTYHGGQQVALVMAPAEFGEFHATLNLSGEIIEAVPTTGSIPTQPSTPQVVWDAPWSIPTRDELEHLIAVWKGRKAPIDTSWYEADLDALKSHHERTYEFLPGWYWSSSTAATGQIDVAWAVFASDGDAALMRFNQQAAVRLIRRIRVVS